MLPPFLRQLFKAGNRIVEQPAPKVNSPVHIQYETAYFPENFPSVPVSSLQSLEEILASPDFGSTRETWGLSLKREIELREREMTVSEPPPWVLAVRQAFAITLRLFVVLAIIIAIAMSFYYFKKHYRKPERKKRIRNRQLNEVSAAAESPESLFLKAENFYKNGFFYEAWAACFSGCLAAYTKHHSIHFPKDATEYGCLKLVKKTLADNTGFEDLVRCWILFIYGGLTPEESAFEKALSFGNNIGAKI